MKLTSSLLAALGFLGPREAVAGAVPAGSGSSSTAGLEARDKYCRLHDDVGPPGHCRTCASRTCESIRNIKKSDRFGVKCRMFGDTVNNIDVWDWVPGWGCYVSASITDPTCEDGIYCCDVPCDGNAGPPIGG